MSSVVYWTCRLIQVLGGVGALLLAFSKLLGPRYALGAAMFALLSEPVRELFCFKFNFKYFILFLCCYSLFFVFVFVLFVLFCFC